MRTAIENSFLIKAVGQKEPVRANSIDAGSPSQEAEVLRNAKV